MQPLRSWQVHILLEFHFNIAQPFSWSGICMNFWAGVCVLSLNQKCILHGQRGCKWMLESMVAGLNHHFLSSTWLLVVTELDTDMLSFKYHQSHTQWKVRKVQQAAEANQDKERETTHWLAWYIYNSNLKGCRVMECTAKCLWCSGLYVVGLQIL